jgi:hypothetical protein
VFTQRLGTLCCTRVIGAAFSLNTRVRSPT